MKIAIITAILTAIALSPAHSQGRPKLAEACKFDIEQYCKEFNVKKQKKQIKECLEKQQRNLLPYCQDRYKNAN